MKKPVELRATPGGGLLHEPVGHLLLTCAAAGTFRCDVVDDVGEATDVAEVCLQTATERHETIASLGDDDDLVSRTTRLKLLQLAVFTRLYKYTRNVISRFYTHIPYIDSGPNVRRNIVFTVSRHSVDSPDISSAVAGTDRGRHQ